MESEKKKVLDYLRISPHAQIVDVCFATGVYWDDVQTFINELLQEGALKCGVASAEKMSLFGMSPQNSR